METEFKAKFKVGDLVMVTEGFEDGKEYKSKIDGDVYTYGQCGEVELEGKILKVKTVGEWQLWEAEYQFNSEHPAVSEMFLEKVGEKAKFKVGEEVRVREDLVVGAYYMFDVKFIGNMGRTRGEVMTLERIIRNGHYNLMGSDCYYTDDMLEKVEKVTIKLDAMELGLGMKDFTLTGSFNDNFGDGEDIINKPSHYTQGGIEPIDFIESNDMSFCQGNVVKYVTRYKFKGGVTDLKKARFYLDKLIKKEEENDG
jgi:hypothetical protein